MATGLLVVCLGAATRLSEYLSGVQKEYQAVVVLGEATDTYDAEGTIIQSCISNFPLSIPDQTLDQFRGKIQQTPPAFSAIKIGGQPAYRLARRGKTVNIAPRLIEVTELTIVDYQAPELKLKVCCSAGTYIRSLAHDLGQALGCGAYLAALTRTRSGPFTIERSHSPQMLKAAFAAGRGADYLLPPDSGLQNWPSVQLAQAEARRVVHGNPVSMNDSFLTGLARAYGPGGDLIAIVEADPVDGKWRPRKVLASG